MYIGSVRFYKHLIYLVMFILAVLLMYSLFHVGCLIASAHAGGGDELENPGEMGLSEHAGEHDNDNNSDNGIPLLQDAESDEDQPEDVQEEASAEEDRISEEPDEKPQENDFFLKEEITYQTLYPELRNDMPVIQQHKSKTVYLTFDDGPSPRTEEILDILKERNIKATFFVVTVNNNLDILKRVAEEGHTIGIHSHTHEYKEIYKSVEAFLEDFNTCYNKIYEAASVKPKIFRFPGGSINAYNRGIYQDIISEMLRRGFLYYDWNISTQDTDKYANKERVLKSVKEGFANQDSIIVLCHDNHNKRHTVDALPEIIDFFEEQGYVFDKLENSVEPVVFAYPH